MTWYYASGGQQRGPVDEAQFDALVQSGQIQPGDLVWSEGMANWQPLSTVRPGAAVGSPPGPAASTGVPPAASDVNASEVTCVECHGRFGKENAVQYGAAWVCSSCKPVFIQKLKEGSSVGGAPPVGELRFPLGSVDPNLLAAGIRERGYQLELGDCLSRAWKLFTANMGNAIGVTAVVGFCMVGVIIISMIPCVGPLIQLALQAPLMAGLFTFFLKLHRERDASMGDAFYPFSHGWIHLVIFNVVSSIVMLVFFAPAAGALIAMEQGVIPRHEILVIGLGVLGLVPMVYLSVAWFFTSVLILDRDLDFWSAMQVSRKVVNLHWGQIFLLLLVVGVLSFVGAIAFCIGLLFTVPLATAALVIAYEDIFNGGSQMT